MLLRNQLLGGCALPEILRAPADMGAGGAGEAGAENGAAQETKHTDVSLQEIAERAFDKHSEAAAAATDEGGAADGKPAAGAGEGGDRGDGRTPRGQFAKKPPAAGEAKTPQAAAGAAKAEGGTEAAAAGTQQQLAGAGAAGEGQQSAAAKAAPPGGFSVKSKADWDKVAQQFPHLVEDIAKREAEISAGFAEYEGLKPFTARAKQQGQSLQQVLTAYTGIEDLIRRDIGQGLMHVVHNAGQTQAEAAATFAQLARRLGFQGFQQAPGNQNPGGSPPDQNGDAGPLQIEQLFTRAVQPLVDRLSQLETTRTRETEAQQRQRLTSAQQVIEAFKTDPAHKFYANVEDKVGDLLESGVVKRTGDFTADLKAAYDMACKLDPQISEVLLNERVAAEAETRRKAETEAAERARKAARSITGAPAPGAKLPQGGRARTGEDKLRAAAERAYDSAAGAV